MLSKPKNNKTSLTVLFCFLILIPGLVYSDPRPPTYYSNNPIVAEVDGEAIRLDDLKHARIQEALIQLHRMKTRALKERVLEKLAKKHALDWESIEHDFQQEEIKKKELEAQQKLRDKFGL